MKPYDSSYGINFCDKIKNFNTTILLRNINDIQWLFTYVVKILLSHGL